MSLPFIYHLTLPYPPSANRYWRIWRGRAVVSTEARQYKTTVGRLCSRLRPLAGPLCVRVDVYRPAKRGDLDNALKCLLDALNGIAFSDDSQIIELRAKRMDDKTKPRVEVWVGEVAA